MTSQKNKFLFSLLLISLYFLMEKHNFIEATWLLRPIVYCLAFLSASGNICALSGAILEKASIIQYQVTILMFMIVLCDVVAVSIVLIMAIGKRMTLTAIAPELLLSQKKFESILGPFWIYLLAILFHMTAAGMMCIIGVNKRYIAYLGDKNGFYAEQKRRLEEPPVEIFPQKDA
uniref:Uncharacterized protein n=1 Tax=Parascaris univalens TaxID=6257 RepID=A0A915B0R4_PARUN